MIKKLRELLEMDDSEEIIYRWEVPDSVSKIKFDGIPQEYLVVRHPGAVGGVIIYARYGDEWLCNPWSIRPLVNHLITECGQLQSELSDKCATINTMSTGILES